MQLQDKPTFFQWLAGLCEIFEKKLSEAALEIYWEALKPYPLEDVKRAVDNIVTTHKYATFPKPAEFIEQINPPVDADFQAELGYLEFEKAYCNMGEQQSFAFKDPVVAMVCMTYGSWVDAFNHYPRFGNEFDTAQFKRDFIKLYKGVARRPLPSFIPRMIGTDEGYNRSMGYLTDARGSAIPLPNGEGCIMVGSPEAHKYLEANDQKLIDAPDGRLVKHE